MPGNILNADTGFPQFTGSESNEQKLDKVMNYLYMLLEQLRYTLNNLDSDNFNETGLKEIAEGISRPLATSFESELVRTNAVIEGWSDEFRSQISSLVQFQKTVEDGTISSIASIEQSAGANSAAISLLNQWKDETSTSLAAVQTKASQNEAKISSLTSWKSTAEDDIDGLTASLAAVEQVADENGASISQIVQAVGADGEVNAASIVSAVNAAESSVTLDADRIHMDGDIYITGKDASDEEAMRIAGNRLQMNHYSDEEESAASLSFWYDGIDNELLGTLRTMRNTDNEKDARYAVVLKTFSRGSDYPVALKLASEGAMSMEAGTSIYTRAGTYLNLHAEYGTRIYANAPFDAAVTYGYAAEPYSYVFCDEGIYWIDGNSDAHLIAANP